MGASPEDQSDLEKARNATLQRIGRNVVNLQKMEGMLKFLLAFGDICAPLSQLRDHVKDRIQKMSRMTLGNLTKKASKALFSELEPPSKVPDDIIEPWFSFSFTVQTSVDAMQGWMVELTRVVDERNRLIHQMLSSFDPRSLQSCQALDAQLEEQRAQISGPYSSLVSMVVAMREAMTEAMAGKVDILPSSDPNADVSEKDGQLDPGN